MLRVFAAFAVVALATLPAPAVAADAPHAWALVVTAQGCTAYWPYVPSYETKAAMLNKNSFSWDGSGCENGKLIDGEGTLTVKTDAGNGYIGTIPHRGRMVSGVLDGTIEILNKPMSCKTSVAAYEACPWKVHHSEQFQMGCEEGDRWCTPRKRLIVSSSGRMPSAASQPASAATVAARNRATDLAANKGTAVPPLRPTITQAAHNPAGEATDCVRVIYADDFDVEHVSTTQKAVFRNTCPHPVEVTWCTLTGDCRPGYTNLFTVPARKDRGFSYEPSVRGSKVAYAACFNGFVPHQGELSKKLNHACK